MHDVYGQLYLHRHVFLSVQISEAWTVNLAQRFIIAWYCEVVNLSLKFVNVSYLGPSLHFQIICILSIN